VETLRVAGRLPDRFEEDLGGSVRVVPEQVMIRFSGDRGTFPLVSAWQVLIGQVDPERFSDRIVMIGVTAEGLGDDWTTPVSTSGRRMSGIEVHANAIESIHSGLSVREVPGWIVLIGLAAVFILLRWVDRRFEGMRFYLVALATVPAAVAASAILMSAGYWLPFPTFLLGVGCVVPTLGVRKLVNVNRDLDQKISRLSVWGGEPLADDLALAGLRSQIDADIIDADIKDARLRLRWRGVLESCERERDGRARRRDGLLAKRRHNAGWKLEAVDFFSEQLHRFVTFNDAVLAGIEDVVIVADPAGQVVYQNTAAEKLRGFSISPPPMWDYLSSLLDRRDLKETFIRVVALSETVRVEKVASEGGSRYYALAIRPIPRIGAVATLVDVTAQHELDRAKNDMVSLVSHELRTPLTSIRGYGSMLARYGLVEEKGQEFLQAILDESARLNELIQSFLDVAAIESGTQKLEPTEFGTATLIDDVLSGLRPVAEPKAITLAKAVAADAGTILADRVLIFQAIVNLVSNAIKYSPPGTAVTVELERAAGQVRFRVVDQGHGIPGEDLRRVFEKFYRRSNDETRSEPGFGLGLSLVRQIAEQHGGGVGVDSAVGAGSVFTFWVPPSC
jgi:signal transduction histidine kinase